MEAHIFALFAWITAVAVAENGGASEESALPRFKWGQTREKLFVTVAVKGLERNSVSMSFGEDQLRFHGLDESGKVFDLDAELGHDIDAKASKWEHLQRPDRWGDGVLATLTKKFPGRWETLVADVKPYRKVMDRDWNREDQQLELPEEDTYLKDHRKYATLLTEKNLKKLRKGVEALVVNVRHKECDQCKVADETFAKAAKELADSKSAYPWQANVRLAIVEARAERLLARSLGGFCATGPQECRHFVLAHGGGDVPVSVKARHEVGALLADLERLAREQFRSVSSNDMSAGRQNASRALIVLGPGSSTEAHVTAHRLRVQADMSVAEGPEASGVAIWPPGETKPDLYDESHGPLEAWLRARAVAPLADTSEFEEDEPYEELKLPVARLFLNGDSTDVAARATVHDLAREFVGRVAFIARNATSKAHEWRHHGLPHSRFPSFAVAGSMAHNATKYAFLDMPKIAPDQQNSSLELDAMFWSGPAKQLLTSFLEEVLANNRPATFPSEDPSDKEYAWGTVGKVVGRTCRTVVESSEGETLIEAFDEWRRDNPNRTKYLDSLAPILARWNITVLRLDLGYNECPPDTIPLISAGYSGYFLVSKMAKQRKLKPARMKKLDPAFAAVLKFIAKHSETNISKSIQAVQEDLEASIKEIENHEYVGELWQHWMWGSGRNYLVAALLGLAGVIAFGRLRQAKKARTSFGPAAPPAAPLAVPPVDFRRTTGRVQRDVDPRDVSSTVHGSSTSGRADVS